MAFDSMLATVIRDLRAAQSHIQRELDAVRGQLQKLSGVSGRGRQKAGPPRPRAPGRRPMSAAGRAAISKAAKKRWAKWRKAKGGK